MDVQDAVTRFGSPYAAIEAFVAGSLSEDELVDVLGGWPFVAVPDPADPAGVTSEARGFTLGSAQDIVRAYARRLIDRRMYARIVGSIHERQGY